MALCAEQRDGARSGACGSRRAGRSFRAAPRCSRLHRSPPFFCVASSVDLSADGTEQSVRAHGPRADGRIREGNGQCNVPGGAAVVAGETRPGRPITRWGWPCATGPAAA